MEEDIRTILSTARIVAVVGLSDKPDRPSHRVAAYLQQHGYKIIPVKNNVTEVLGEKAYATLREIPAAVDVVDIFRKSADVPPIVDEAIRIGAKAVWMQEGVVNAEAARKARAAGLAVVMDRCILKEHQKHGDGHR